jgi:hypothetical protein
MRMASTLAVLCWGMGLGAQVRADEKSHRAAVTELCTVMQLERMLQDSTDKMMEIQMQQLPGMQHAKAQLDKFFAKYLSWAALKEDYITLYMQTFSEPEVRELIAFYKTPTGSKAVQQMPLLFQRGAEIGSARVRQHMPELMELMKAAAAGDRAAAGQPLEDKPLENKPKPASATTTRTSPPAATRGTQPNLH